MAFVIKEFCNGGFGISDIHSEVRQIRTKNGSYLFDNETEGLYGTICGFFSDLPGIQIDKAMIKEALEGKSTYVVHPSILADSGTEIPCEILHLTDGSVQYENTVTLSRKGNGAHLKMECKFGELVWESTYSVFSIEKEDLCYAAVGSLYRRLEDGGTVNRIVHEPFATQEEAESYLQMTAEDAKDFDCYQVEVFSRKHLLQTKWYRDSAMEYGFFEREEEREEREER